MKVIGKSEQGYLISATEREIAQLFGRYPSEDAFKKILNEQLGREGFHGRDLVGLEIEPGIAFQQLAWLRRRDREFDDLCSALRKAADMIQDHRPLFNKIAGDDSNAA